MQVQGDSYGRGVRKYTTGTQKKNTGSVESHYGIVHFSLVQTFPPLRLEKVSWQKKKKGKHFGGGGAGALLNSAFWDISHGLSEKGGCAALNHKSLSLAFVKYLLLHKP